MSRQLRIEYPGALYHVTSRGNERKNIFCSRGDKEKFYEYLFRVCSKFDAIIYVYGLMTNHYHLMIKTMNANLSRIIHYLNMSYTNYFNRKRRRNGHLFQGRYKSILVDEENYLVKLSRYIHLNPVRAGMVDKPEEYEWSSYKYFIYDLKIPKILDINSTLKYFAGDKKQYRGYVEDGLITGMDNPLLEVMTNTILGKKEFVEDIVEKYVKNLNEERDIPGITGLKKKYISKEKITNIIDSEVNLNKYEKYKYKIYFLHKYTTLSLNDILEFTGERQKSKSSVSMVISRMEAKIKESEKERSTIYLLADKM